MQFPVCTECSGRRKVDSSWQAPGSYGFAKLFEREQVRCKCLSVAELNCSIAALRIEEIKQAGSSMLVGELSDFEGLLSVVEIARPIEGNDLIVRANVLKSIPHVGQHLSVRVLLQFLCLCDGEAGAGNFPLVAIENGNLNLTEQRDIVAITEVGVADLTRNISLADGLLQRMLAVRCIDSQLRSMQIRPVLKSLCLEVFKISHDRLVIERSGNVIVSVYRFISEQLPKIRKSLHPGELCRGHVRLELEHL